MKKQIRVFLVGDYKALTGPSSVNKHLLTSSMNKLHRLKAQNKIIKGVEYILKLIFCDVVVFSGFTTHAEWGIKLLKALHKKSIYLMHGCASYENEINQLRLSSKMIKKEGCILDKVDLVLGVSEQYMEWVKERYPQYDKKIYYLNNGVNSDECEHDFGSTQNIARIYDVAVAGGDRKQKNNIKVSEAVELLNREMNRSFILNVYGRQYYEDGCFSQFSSTKYKGMLPYEQFIQELDKTKLFIINSTVESFGLSVVDALLSGCSVLLTKNTGICSVLTLEETDIIYDNENATEIANKIKFLLENPNNKRILDSIDFEHYTWAKVGERLYAICEALYYGKDYTMIK